MANRRGREIQRYRQNERILTFALITDTVIFLLYLLFAGLGVTWMKIVLAIAAILISGLCLGSLYLTGELRRHRSLWLVTGFGAIAACLVFSLLLNYPSPSKSASNQPKDQPASAAVWYLDEKI